MLWRASVRTSFSPSTTNSRCSSASASMSSGRRNGTCRTPLTLHTQPSFTLSGGSSGRARRRWRKDLARGGRPGTAACRIRRCSRRSRRSEPLRAVVVSVAKSVLLEPLRNFPHALALEENYNPAAFAGLVVEPGAFADISTAGAVGPPAQFLLVEWRRFGSAQKCRATSGMIGQARAPVMSLPHRKPEIAEASAPLRGPRGATRTASRERLQSRASRRRPSPRKRRSQQSGAAGSGRQRQASRRSPLFEDRLQRLLLCLVDQLAAFPCDGLDRLHIASSTQCAEIVGVDCIQLPTTSP